MLFSIRRPTGQFIIAGFTKLQMLPPIITDEKAADSASMSHTLLPFGCWKCLRSDTELSNSCAGSSAPHQLLMGLSPVPYDILHCHTHHHNRYKHQLHANSGTSQLSGIQLW